MRNPNTGLHEPQFKVFMAEINGETHVESIAVNKTQVAGWIKDHLTIDQIESGRTVIQILEFDVLARERQ